MYVQKTLFIVLVLKKRVTRYSLELFTKFHLLKRTGIVLSYEQFTIIIKLNLILVFIRTYLLVKDIEVRVFWKLICKGLSICRRVKSPQRFVQLRSPRLFFFSECTVEDTGELDTTNRGGDTRTSTDIVLRIVQGINR